MSDTDATQARQDVVANVDEIIEHVINANMSNMPYEVYSELFDAVDGLGAEIENLQAENAKLREVVEAILQCAGETKRDKGCDACPMFNADGNFLVKYSWCHLYPTLRELGIKVEDD